MISLLKSFLKERIKYFSISYKDKGFTLIELLVAMIISSIILGSLLTFLFNIVNSERQEQAKATAQQETQTALDYIANDLQEAVYVYDATGIAEIKSQIPGSTDSDKVPVLVFWKRNFLPEARNVTSSSGTITPVGCLVQIPNTTNCDRRDYFVYSLVAYYLIKDSDATWSSTARIGRWEIQDGIKDPYSNTYVTNRSPGFQLFDLNNSGTFQNKMNVWRKKTGENYTANIVPLVDYVDQSTGSGVPAIVNCTTTLSSNAQQVPANGTTANPLSIYSFYACVDSSKNIAQVYLRGNALARIEPGATYNANQSTYFPTANVQVKNRGALGS
jgi:prepilin-type N-terminal cleavage/methylation domain-containing protein